MPTSQKKQPDISLKKAEDLGNGVENASVNLETEVKFIVPDYNTFAALKTLKRLGNFQLKPIGPQKIVDRYVDGVNHPLRQAGYACRFRTLGKKQTFSLKSLTPPQEGIHRRRELEVEVESDLPQTWPDSQAKTLVLELTGDALLQPLFTLYQTRHKYHVYHQQDEPVLEFSLDAVSLSENEQIDYFELEAELLDAGSEIILQQFINTVQGQWSLQINRQSKFEWAYLAHFQQTHGIRLTEAEKSVLEQLVDVDDKLLSKRALIILMSSAGVAPENIAKEVAFTPRTVKKWQKEFITKRLKIFAEEALPQKKEAKPRPALGRTHPLVKSAKKNPKKPKTKKQPQSVNYQQTSVGLKPTDTFAEAGRKVLGFHFAQLVKHESGAKSGKNIEELHNMRVATRRMRAAFKVFGSGFSPKILKPLRQGLKETAQALAPGRDMDVFIEKLREYQQTLAAEAQTGLQPLLEICQTRRDEARAKMLAYLDNQKYLKFKKKFRRFIKTEGMGVQPIPDTVPPIPHQLRHIVPGLIYTYYEEVRAYETILHKASLDTLHQLRISLKGLRYTLEYLEEVLGEEQAMLIAEVKALQDHLGEMNDADVAADMLRGFLVEWEERQLHLPLAERQSPTQIVSYLNASIEKRHQQVVTFPDAWEHFNRPEVRQNLAKAIALL